MEDELPTLEQDLAEIRARAAQKRNATALEPMRGAVPSARPSAPAAAPEESPLAKLGTAVKSTVGWARSLPANIGKGALDAAVGTGRMMWDGLRDSLMDAGEFGDEESTAAQILGDTSFKRKAPPPANPAGMSEQELRERASDVAAFQTEQANTPLALDEQAGAAYDTWRRSLSEDDNLADTVTQSIAQFAIPFTAFSKAYGVTSAATKTGMVARAAGAEASTMMSAFDPETGRLSDLVELGRQAEGKFGGALRAVAPDDSLTNHYITWMVEREGETGGEARFKNAVDSLVGSAAVAGLFKAGAMTFKAARGQRAKAAAAAPVQEVVSQPKPLTVVETPAGFEVEHPVGKLEFATAEDAAAHVEEVKNILGPEYPVLAAAQQADPKVTDKNFATLHTFSRVLKANADRPVSTKSLVASLEKHIKGDTEQGAFYKELLGRLKNKNLPGLTSVLSEPGPVPTASGGFVPKSNAVKLYPSAFSDPMRMLHVFTHEAVHAATVAEIRQSAKVSTQLQRLHKKITDAFPETGEGKKPYGFTDPEEFVAEIESNPVFRKLMKTTKVDGETAWDAYKKAIAGILGLGALALNPEFDKLMDPKETTGA